MVVVLDDVSRDGAEVELVVPKFPTVVVDKFGVSARFSDGVPLQPIAISVNSTDPAAQIRLSLICTLSPFPVQSPGKETHRP